MKRLVVVLISLGIIFFTFSPVNLNILSPLKGADNTCAVATGQNAFLKQ